MGKKLFLVIYFAFFLIFFIAFEVPILTELSFILNFISLTFFMIYNIQYEKEFSPFLSVFIVFQILFFIVAPVVQIDFIVSKGFDGSGSFIQNFPFTEGMCIRANAYIFLFNIVFFMTYLYFKRRIRTSKDISYNYPQIPLYLLALAFFSILLILFNFKSILFQYQNEFYKEAEQTSVSSYLIVQKFLYFIPFSAIILAQYYLKSKNKLTVNFYVVVILLVFFIAVILFLKNPLTEKRNALGPLYITLLFLFFRKILNTNYKVTSFMFFSMVLIFPILTIITHSRYTLSQMIAKPILISKNIEYLSVNDAFNSLHYDAYPNFLATIDFYDKKPVVYGEQLSCSLFFFVPRSLWKDKPETTGFKIGNYLIDKYKFNFNNLSNPYISEAYINFGIIGIILFASALSYFFMIMIRWIQSQDYLKVVFAFYFSIYLMYFLRGDLTNGFAFIVAFWMAVIVVPKYIFALIMYYVRK